MNKIYQKPFPGEKNAGFTLIELLVVVLIIGILAAVALPGYQVAVGRARVVRVLPVLRALMESKNRYYLNNGEYTPDIDALDVQIPYSSRVEVDGGTWLYHGTPVGDVNLASVSAAVFWSGEKEGVAIDVTPSYQICYAYAGSKVGEKICASLGPSNGGISDAGTPVHYIKL